MPVYGYDPDRVEQLHRRTVDAVGALAAVRCDDPGACDALQVAAGLRRHLEDEWLPLLAAIRLSAAMRSWSTTVAPGAWPPWLDDLVVGPLVTRTVSTGLERLTVADLVRGVVAAGRTFDAAASAAHLDTEAARAWRELERHVAELARRIVDDPTAVALVWRELGPDRLAALIAQHATAVDLTPVARLGDGDPLDGSSTQALAVVLGALTRHAAEAADLVARLASSAVVVPAAIAADPARFAPTFVLDVARDLLAVARAAPTLNADRAEEVRAAAGLAVRGAMSLPLEDRDALVDDELLAELATSRLLGDDDVELVVTALLVGRPGDDAGRVAGLRRLAVVTQAAHDHGLNDGVRRGLALGIGPFLRPIATQLVADDATQLVVAVGDETVAFGPRERFATMLGQVVEDERAQLVLGVTVSAFRSEQLVDATAMLRLAPGDVAGARDAFVAPMSEIDRILDCIRTGIALRESEHTFQHGLTVGRTTAVVDALTTALSLFGPATTVVRVGTWTGSKLIAVAVRAAGPPTIDASTLFEEQERDAHLAILGLPLDHPDVRARLGLELVPAATWADVGGLRDELTDTTDPARRAETMARLRERIRQDPWLHGYMTVTEVLTQA